MSAKAENRVSQRYAIENSKISYVEFIGVGKFCLHNLSYGGFGIDSNKLPAAFSAESLNQKYEVKLGLFGEETPGLAMMVFRSAKITGFAFCHETADMLIYLSRVLDRMRIGSTLEVVPKKLCKDAYKTDEWTCLHGDGPTDLRVETENKIIKQAILSFRAGEDYFDLLFKGTGLEMRRNIDTEGVAARMSTDKSLDPNVVRQAMSILIGLSQSDATKHANSLLNIGLNAVGALSFPQ